MRRLKNLPSNIKQFCEGIIDLVENKSKTTNLIGFANCLDKGVRENLRRLISITYLGKHYEIELDYMRRKNGDSLYVRCGDRRLIQYVFNKFVFNENGQIIFKHDGKVHGIKNLPPETIFKEVEVLEPSLLIENQAIYLGRFDTDSFGEDEKNTFLSSLIKYAIIRSNKRHAIKSTDLNNELMGMGNSIVDLLLYKKQIILQGPPGTGKTRLAKEIAQKIIGNNDDIYLSNYLKKGLSIPNASGAEDYYFLEKVTSNSVELSSEKATKKWSASFNKIQEKLSQLRRGESPNNKGGDDPYVLAVAKYVFKNSKNSSDSLENNDQFKLIQFHPSYTYEDFVRGIVAESNGENIEYKNVNKTLGLFTEKALKNYADSNKDIATMSNEIRVKEAFEKFKEYINDEIEKSLGFFNLTENVGLITTDDEDAFRYKGKNDGWLRNGNRMLFKDILQAYTDNNTVRQDIKKNKLVSGLARQHASYFIRVLNLFQEFIEKESNLIDSDSLNQKVDLKNYVLIIDEINRANLSSVLGELIYALEYRGEEVESMYEVDGSQKLILPPNLFIIGTMNTADRSVGHIDYAIRRRFAFIDVLPEKLNDSEEIIFHKRLYESVSKLFVKDFNLETEYDSENVLNNEVYLSGEFSAKDVWLGHSYFIQKIKKDDNGNIVEKIPSKMSMRLDYEIKPILLEYVRDGVLKSSAIEEIKKLSV